MTDASLNDECNLVWEPVMHHMQNADNLVLHRGIWEIITNTVYNTWKILCIQMEWPMKWQMLQNSLAADGEHAANMLIGA